MHKLARRLEKQGFCVVNIGYPSRKKPVPALSKDTIPAAIAQCESLGAGKIHFVTHSLGGILVRYFLAHQAVAKLGRVVMLSPPNGGSEVVDKLGDTFIFKWIYGPAGRQLGTGIDDLPRQLGAVDYEVGIITGDRSINPILSMLIPGKDDGKVSVENAKLRGMTDFWVVHKSHPFIMSDKQVIHQTVTFLKQGRFDKDILSID